MTIHSNTSGGLLILPDGTEIANGANAEIPAAMAKNAGVAEWLASGWLVPVKANAEDDAKVAQPAMPTGKK